MKRLWVSLVVSAFTLSGLGVAHGAPRAEFRMWLQHLSMADENAYFSVPRPVGLNLSPAPESSVLLTVVYGRDGSPVATQVLKPSGFPAMDRYFVTWVASHWRLPARFADVEGSPAQITREIILKKRGLVAVSESDLLAHSGQHYLVRR